MAHTQCGTPCYMSWEMLKGQPYDSMTDLFSLGVVILQMMTGRSHMMSLELKRHQRFFDDLKRKSGYSVQLIDLVMRLLSVDPQNRPSAQECYNAIRRIQKHKRGGRIDLEDHMALKDFTTLPQDLKMRVFIYLDCFDVYQVMCSNRELYSLCEQQWWMQFCQYTRLGKQIMKLTSESIRGQSGFEGLENVYKERVYMYVRYYRKKRRREISNIGKNIVTELLPSQVEEAVNFLTTCLMLNEPNIGNILLNGMNPANRVDELRDSNHNDPPGNSNLSTQAPSTSSLSSTQSLWSPSSSSTTTATMKPKAEVSVNSSGNRRSQVQRREPIVQISGRIRRRRAASTGPNSNKTLLGMFNQLKFIVRCLIKLGLKYGRVYCCNRYAANGSRILLGISIWQHPYSSTSISLKKILRCGGRQSLKILGLNRSWRMYQLIDQYDRIRRLVMDDRSQPYWTLLLCGVKPDWQRKGVGASILLPILKAADETALPVLTNVFFPNLESIKFYRRYGFDVVKKCDDSQSPQQDLPYWILIRHAGG